MSHSNRNWHQRYKQMGDEAEHVFEETYPHGYVRYGLNRPPIRVGDLPIKIRYTPDYLTTKGLVEVMGCGSQRVLKLKAEKLQAMWEWSHDFRVDLFVWDRKEKHFGFCHLDDIADLCYNGDVALSRFESDNKLYFAIPVDDLPVAEWIGYEKQ